MDNYLLFLALIPGIIIIIYILRKDKVEHEPMSLIIKLLVLGAISCVPAIFLESGVTALNPGLKQGTIELALYDAFLVAALCEEVCKFAFLRLGSWRNKHFDYRFDGIVYGVAVAVGFALLENVMYVIEGGIYTALMRGVLTVPLHAFCGVFMGISYGAARKYSIMGQRVRSGRANLRAILIPILIHGIYD
ncbi:MAG: PrsW family glutamic-type intramembrane protease, partial [Eubacteriales bacterium]|nr:PrsW family glutamic-type intramembrane protease [Eubacteriales bacterium]